jgi:hypothetical protein
MFKLPMLRQNIRRRVLRVEPPRRFRFDDSHKPLLRPGQTLTRHAIGPLLLHQHCEHY